MKKKYELTKDTIEHAGVTLYRIKALKNFGRVRKGDLGGFIEKEANLSQTGECWIGGGAKVYNDACVFEDAQVFSYARVGGRAGVFGRAKVFKFARVFGGAKVFEFASVGGNTYIYGNAKVFGHALVIDRASVYDYAKLSGYVLAFQGATVICNYEVSGREILGGGVCYSEGGIRPVQY